MGRRESLGRLEELVLLAVMRLGPESYGVTIRQEIELHAGRDLSLGAIYPTLDRLEDQGLVRSRRGQPTGERGGRSRRHFELLPDGYETLRQSRRAMVSMWAGFEPDGEAKS
jgi:PadR family transcriptional regulator PadR